MEGNIPNELVSVDLDSVVPLQTPHVIRNLALVNRALNVLTTSRLQRVARRFGVLHVAEASTVSDIWRLLRKPCILHTNEMVMSVCALSDRYFVSAGLDKTVRVWDLEGREQVRELEGHTTIVLL